MTAMVKPTFLDASLLPVLLLLHSPFVSVECLLSAPPPSPPRPDDVVGTFSLYDDRGGGPLARCREVRPPPLLERSEEEDDEVELWYPTRRRAFVFEAAGDDGGGEESSGEAPPRPRRTGPLTVRQTSFGCGKLGSSVWPSSVATCLHLASNPDMVRGRRVLELGAGCGLPSLLCRDGLGAESVLATDFWELDDDERGGSGDDDGRKGPIPARLHGANLEHNVRGERAHVLRVDWHDQGTVREARAFGADLIVGSDLVYYPSNVGPLIDTLKTLMEEDGGASEALLVAPLPPAAERESLPEFRRKLPLGLGGHSVEMDKIVLRRREDGENQRFLRIAISQ